MSYVSKYYIIECHMCRNIISYVNYRKEPARDNFVQKIIISDSCHMIAYLRYGRK